MAESRSQRAAVIGLGAMGLVGVKNLLEEGFQVVGFEKNAYIGGLWHYTDDENTLSVLHSTIANVSIDQGCYTDFPFQKNVSSFPLAKDVEEYLERYTDHFQLRPHLRLNTAIKRVFKDDEDGLGRWRVEFEDGSKEAEYFDKVLIATGPHLEPVWPDIEGRDGFQGRILHSKSFKRPEIFDGLNVVILGLGNTGCDVAESLVGHASNVSIAHSRGAIVLPRDSRLLGQITYRFSLFIDFLERWCPSLSEYIFNNALKSMMKKAFGDIETSLRLHSPPSVKVTNPLISDTLISRLRSGDIKSVPALKRIHGPKVVELDDGSILESDVIICCTGYKYGFKVLDPRYDPSAEQSVDWKNCPGSKGRSLPRLYQNVFSLKEPQSLAFLGCAWFATSAFCLADLASMCVAQIWAGNSTLPAQSEMQSWMDRQEKKMCHLARRGTVLPAAVSKRDWLLWFDKTAGTGVEENLGWGFTSWKFWWQERKFCGMLLNGPFMSAVWRVFDGKRKKWEGARAEIEEANRLQQQQQQQRAQKEDAKKSN